MTITGKNHARQVYNRLSVGGFFNVESKETLLKNCLRLQLSVHQLIRQICRVIFISDNFISVLAITSSRCLRSKVVELKCIVSIVN